MFTQPAEAIVASLVFLALFIYGLGELFKKNIGGVLMGAVLLGLGFFAANQVGVDSGQVIAAASEVISFAFSLVASVSASVAAATGLPQTVVVLGLLAVFVLSRRTGKAKK